LSKLFFEKRLYCGGTKMNFREWLLTEVEWDTDPSSYGFSDVERKCMTINELIKGLNQQLARYRKDPKYRERFPRSAERTPKSMLLPQYTRSNMEKVLSGEGGFNVQTVLEFAESLTQEPATIFDIGEKSQHSNELDPGSFVINTGIPALRAVIFDEKTKEFYSINTCVGAGDCILNCFALKAFYVLSDGKNIKLHQRINLLVNNPELYYKKAFRELRAVALREIPDGKTLKIRWNDAGDWFSRTYFNIASKVTKDLKSIKIRSSGGIDEPSLFGTSKKKDKIIDFKDKILSYGYTKQGDYVNLGREEGILMNFSLGAKPEEVDKVKLPEIKLSKVVPKEVTEGIFARKEKDKPWQYKPGKNDETLRDTITKWAKKEGLLEPQEKILFMKELVKIRESKPFWETGKKLHVMVLPGESDMPAYRHDVHYTFLLEH
jgi:hypothetical protein